MITVLTVAILVGFFLLYVNYGRNKRNAIVGFLCVLIAWIIAILKYFNLI